MGIKTELNETGISRLRELACLHKNENALGYVDDDRILIEWEVHEGNPHRTIISLLRINIGKSLQRPEPDYKKVSLMLQLLANYTETFNR